MTMTSLRSPIRELLLLLCIAATWLIRGSYAFTILATPLRVDSISRSRVVQCMTADPLFTDESITVFDATVEPNDGEEHGVEDANGNEFKVGGVVRVAVGGCKAYQVAKKGKGSFNEDKEFVADEDSPYLILPVGLRGTVTKVYNVEEISANFPVQVKFVPGKHTDEGFDTPVAFLMHFLEDEVEVVV